MSYNALIQVDGKKAVITDKNKIIKIEKGSPSHKYGIKVGEKLVSINGTKVKDILDYRYLGADEKLTLIISNIDNVEREIVVEKDMYEDLGMEFETGIIDKANSCSNKCIFCFIIKFQKE